MDQNHHVLIGSIKNRLGLAIVTIGILIITGCATAGSQSRLIQQTDRSPPETREQSKAEPLTDEEDALVYRLLAVPEYLWEGISYPIKRLSIFYERVDLMERALDFFLNDERTGGIYPRFALGGIISSGIGFTAFENNLFNQGKEGRVSYLFGVRGNQQGEVSYIDPSVLGTAFKFEAAFNATNFDEGRFFLNGNQAREEDKTLFSLTQFDLGARLSRAVFGDLSASLLGRFFFAEGDQSDKAGEQIPLTVAGVGPAVHAFEVEPGLRYDSRDNPFSPSTGGFLDATFTYTDQFNGDDFRYLGYTLEARRYLPVFRGNRILVLRSLFGKQSPVDGRSIPFYELNILDLDHGLRGFSRGRFRDRGRLLFNVEWRYPIWERFDGSVFLDAGQVFSRYRDIDTADFQYSVGFGFRFATTRQFAFRAHVAVSEDGVLALLRGDLEFIRKRGSVLGEL